jgi:cytochrome c oxidase subunit 2
VTLQTAVFLAFYRGTNSAWLQEMHKSLALALIGIAAVMIGIAAAQDQPAQPRKLDVTAKKYEFDVSRIEMKVGETVELTLNSLDTKHGFECKELGIQKVTFEKDKPATVTLTAAKPGTYAFKCANFCGMGHGRMKGQIVVLP